MASAHHNNASLNNGRPAPSGCGHSYQGRRRVYIPFRTLQCRGYICRENGSLVIACLKPQGYALFSERLKSRCNLYTLPSTRLEHKIISKAWRRPSPNRRANKPQAGAIACRLQRGLSSYIRGRFLRNVMKRDMELFREILLVLESGEPRRGSRRLSISGYSDEVISYHVKLLKEAGLIEAFDASSKTSFAWFPQMLTSAGHDFIDAAKDQRVWVKVKGKIQEMGGEGTLAVLKVVVEQVTKNIFKND
jgi:DNA-binding transcriptional ArsR family regulator